VKRDENAETHQAVSRGRGKGDAVRLGFSKATGDILMILDADISVTPENLVDFYEVLLFSRHPIVCERKTE
jgi:glycosyltransferase involved in cell wall biosynthesis